jgi:hypothetical protein
MPRIFLSLLIILSFSLLSNAQFSKGSLLVGGDLSFSSRTTSDNGSNTSQSYRSGFFYVSLGKAISENAVLGVNLTYSPYSVTNLYPNSLNTLGYKSNSYVFGIFFRKYKPLGKEFFLFGEAGAGFNLQNDTGKDSLGVVQLSGSGSGGQINFMPGVAYKVSKKFFIEITIPNIFLVQFNSSHENYPNAVPSDAKYHLFNISTSLNSNPLSALGIGFRLNL